MADNVTLSTPVGTGATVATDECSVNAITAHVQWIKLGYGTYDSFTPVTSSAGLPVAQQGTWTVTGAGGSFPVTDSSGSLTVDAPVGTPVFVRLSDGSSAISTLPVSLASVPSHDVTNAGTFAVQAAQSGTWNVGTVTTVSTVTAVTTVSTVTSVSDAQVQGKAAHDAVVSGNPVLLGGYASASAPSAVSADGDAVRVWCDLSGRLQVGDGGSSLTVDNAALSVTGGGVESSALRVTLASDSTGLVSVDDNGGSLTVDAPVGTPVFVRLSDGSSAITTLPVSLASVPSHAVTNAGTFAVQESGAALTALQLIDNLVLAEDAAHQTGDPGVQALTVRKDTAAATSGADGDYQPAVSNARGATWVAIENGSGGQVTSFGGGTQYQEDAAHSSGDTGTMALAVRNDSDASLCGTTGDYTPLQVDSNGYLKVNIKAGAGSGGTASTDDAAFTAASGSGTPMMGFVTSDSVDSGDVGVVGMLANRQLKVTLYDSGGVELAVGGGTQYTEDAAAAANPTGNALIMVRADSLAGVTTTDGDNVAARGTDKGELYVKHADTIAVTQSGTWNVGTVTTVSTVSTVTNVATIGTSVTPGTGAAHLGKAEDAAHSSGDTGVFVLAVRSDTAASTGQTDGDYTALVTDSSGRLHVNVGNTVTVGSHAVTNAGTFAVQVDGAALTSLQLIDDAVYAEDVAAQAGDKGLAILAVRRDADTTLVGADNDYANLQVDANGYLKVEIFDGGGSHTVDNAGTFAVQVDGSALTALQKIDDPVLVDDAAFTPATSSVMMAGFEADESSTDSVDEGDAGAARMTLDRKVIVNPQPHTAGGLSIFRSLDLDETEEDVKTSAGQVYGWWIFNASTSIRYVKFYNATAANVTVGSTTPVLTLPIPAASSGGVAANLLGAMGIAFDTAISVAATTGLADNDTGAPSAADVIINIWYK